MRENVAGLYGLVGLYVGAEPCLSGVYSRPGDRAFLFDVERYVCESYAAFFRVFGSCAIANAALGWRPLAVAQCGVIDVTLLLSV